MSEDKVQIDFNEVAGSLLISFGRIGEETFELTAKVLVSLCGGKLAGVEILLDKDVAEKIAGKLR